MRTIPNAPTQPELVGVDTHMICMVDRSGSMNGPKTIAANTFVENSFQTAIEEGFKTFTVVEFNSLKISDITWNTSGQFDWKPRRANDGTPLYKVLASYLPKFLELKGQVLVNVISDGQDTDGGISRAQEMVRKFINSGQTLTFICTETDKRRFTEFGIPDSNIQTYNNTGEGLAQTFEVYRGAVQNYSVSVAKGEDVTRGFYKTVKN